MTEEIEDRGYEVTGNSGCQPAATLMVNTNRWGKVQVYRCARYGDDGCGWYGFRLSVDGREADGPWIRPTDPDLKAALVRAVNAHYPDGEPGIHKIARQLKVE